MRQGWGLVFLTSISIGSPLHATEADHTGTITRKIGKVTILKNPSQSPAGAAAPRVKFGNMYYTEVQAERGSQVQLGEVVQTGKIGRARLIFPNGDQFTVSTQTTLQIAKNKAGRIQAPEVRLSQGKFRALIDSAGPRSGSVVRTRSMVMGVRGTDFFVTSRIGTGLSQVSVIRGQVGVKPAGVAGDEVPVDAGYSAGVGKLTPGAAVTDEDANALIVKVEKTPPVLLAQIDEFSKLPGMTGGPGQVMVASERTPEQIERDKRLIELEKKAVDSSLRDIKKDDPQLFETLKQNPDAMRDTDKINAQATKQLEKGAEEPSKSTKRYFRQQ